jgi:ATP-binding cassette subfamily B protein
MPGDIMQRIYDHTRIQAFLTSTTLSGIFSLFSLVIFGVVLVVYNSRIFTIFLISTVLYISWVALFMKKRRELDYKRFQEMSENQNNLYNIINGIQEIKLNNYELQQRWGWERIQAKLFRINNKALTLSQYQQSGSLIIDQLKNILISFFVAQAVIKGEMTLGGMLAVQYVIGQLNGPIGQLIGLAHATQDAKISLERLREIHVKKDEESPDDMKITFLPENKNISIINLSFQYKESSSEFALRDINLEIPQGKVTAVVGTSGSGKTTLIKLLLNFYRTNKGEIRVGGCLLDTLSIRLWRQSCGVVMQDGYIFPDTIAKNIAISDEGVDKKKLVQAVRLANIMDWVESLPLGYNAKIGMEGHGLSAGQKQRILIARSIYKDPEFLFFDEATNALDANNERIIMNYLHNFFRGRTVVIVAHRLSTVMDADQIVVLEKGLIAEKGTHLELLRKEAAYFRLVKDQLALGA